MPEEIPATENSVKPDKPINELLAALAKAQAEFGELKKNKTAIVKMKEGGTYTYSYSTLDACFSASRPALTKNELAVSQILSGKPNNMYLRTILGHSSGQIISSTFQLFSDDSGRKNPIQAMGSAITYLRRYAYTAMIGLVADEDTDGGGGNDTDGDNKNQRANPNTSNKKPPPKTNKWTVSQPQRKRLFAIMKDAAWNNEMVKDQMRESFNKDSTKDLNKAEYEDLCIMIKKNPYEGGGNENDN